MLATADKDLEANARKIKHICKEDLEYIAKTGRFDLQATPYGNILWAMLNSLADVWANDTELVESINSMVRLIGTRSPRIELASMSSRIMIKKTILPLGPQKSAAAKKWSKVRSLAEPLLKEMIQSGTGYKQILAQADRFTTVCGVALCALHPVLKNEDPRAAQPGPVEWSPDALQWAHHFAIQWKRGSEKVGKSDHLGVVRGVSLQLLTLEVRKVAALRDLLLQDNDEDEEDDVSAGNGGGGGDGDAVVQSELGPGTSCDGAGSFAHAKPHTPNLAYVRAASCRSRLLMAIMEADSDPWLHSCCLWSL